MQKKLLYFLGKFLENEKYYHPKFDEIVFLQRLLERKCLIKAPFTRLETPFTINRKELYLKPIIKDSWQDFSQL
jgi:hypothetical protein